MMQVALVIALDLSGSVTILAFDDHRVRWVDGMGAAVSAGQERVLNGVLALAMRAIFGLWLNAL